MNELLGIFEKAAPGFKKNKLPRSSNGKKASIVHVITNLLEISTMAAKKIVAGLEGKIAMQFIPTKVIGFRKPVLMGKAEAIAGTMLTMKLPKAAAYVAKFPERFYEIANGLKKTTNNNPVFGATRVPGESVAATEAGPMQANESTIAAATEAGPMQANESTIAAAVSDEDDEVGELLKEMKMRLRSKMEDDAAEFCKCLGFAEGSAETRRWAGFGKEHAEKLLKNPYIELKRNGYDDNMKEMNKYYINEMQTKNKKGKKIFKIAWGCMQTRVKKESIGLMQRDRIAQSLKKCNAKILLARFFFIVNLWWKEIENKKKRLWLTASDARQLFGNFRDQGSNEIRIKMNRKIAVNEFFPGCLYKNKIVPQLFVKNRFSSAFVQSPRTYEYEKFLATSIRQLIATTHGTVVDDVAAALLDAEQKRAVNFGGNFQIVYGGPGSGKTLVLIQLIEKYNKIYDDEEIQVVAPTHKALEAIRTRFFKNKDMSTSTRVRFNTCASVAYSGKKIKVLIIDECGMVGTKMMFNVWKKTNPKIVCFFGDPNQLPPIDVGNPFGSILQVPTVPRVELIKNYRQEGSGIRRVIEGIKIGEWCGGNEDVAVNQKSIFQMGYRELSCYLNPLADMIVSPTNRAVNFLNNVIYTLHYKTPVAIGSRVLIIHALSPDYRLGTVTQIYGSLPDSEVLVYIDDVLDAERFPQCMLRSLPYKDKKEKLSLGMMHGGMRIRIVKKYKIIKDNILLYMLQPNVLGIFVNAWTASASADCKDCAKCPKHPECPKHPAMILMQIDGEEEQRPVPLDCIALGWAYTVHKSQGSEENSVLFVVADRDEYWCDRSLVYVAASRAKKSLRVNGSDAQLRQIVARPAAKPSDLIALRLCA